jgi:ankyrin repeat protein
MIIQDLGKLDITPTNDVIYDNKKISSWWGRTYITVKSGSIICENFSPFIRLIHKYFGYKQQFKELDNALVSTLKSRLVSTTNQSGTKIVSTTNQSGTKIPVKLVSQLLSNNPKDDSDLHWNMNSSDYSDADIIQYFKDGYPIEGKNLSGIHETPLNFAVKFHRYEVAEYLLSQGAKISSDSNSPLSEAIRIVDEKMVDHLLKYPIDFSKGDFVSKAVEAATRAISSNSQKSLYIYPDKDVVQNTPALRILSSILAKNPPISAFNEVVRSGDLGLITAFIDRGAKVDEEGSYSPLISAINSNSLEIVRLLIQKGASLNFNYSNPGLWIHQEKLQPLDAAVKRTKIDIEIVRLLIDKGAKLHNKKDLKFSNKEVIELLLNQNLLTVEDMKGSLNQYLTSSYEVVSLEHVNFLLDNGAEINVFSGGSWGGSANHVRYSSSSPLEKAIMMDNIALMELLLKRGADVNFRGSDERTPLHYAVQEGNIPVIQWLKRNGADLSIKDKNGKSPADYPLSDAVRNALLN